MRPFLLLCLILFPAQVFAQDGCDDLWFTRNLMFDQAGYCFGSALGQAVFDNGNCRGKNVSLTGDQKRLADEIRRLEGVYGCKLNTKQARALALNDGHIRRRLTEQPIRDEFESACLGYLGAPLPLYAGTTRESGVIGQVNPGDRVSYAHYDIDRTASYVTTHGDDWRDLRSGGWLLDRIGDSSCRDWAG